MTALTASSCRRASSPLPRTLGRFGAAVFAGAAFTVFLAPALTMCAASARRTALGQRRPLRATPPEIALRNTPRRSYPVRGEGGRMDVWQILRDRLDYASFVPTPLADIQRADLHRRDGTPYTMLKNPHGDRGAGRYLRLDPADVQLYELMDGRRTIQEILVAHLERSGSFAIDRLAPLTANLRINGVFGEEPPPLYEKLLMRRALRDALPRAALFLRRLP